MKPPPLPDWLLYLSAVALVLFVAENRQEKVNSPAPPPPPPGEEGLPLDAALPFDPAGVVKAPAASTVRTGAAFSVAERGVWLTARDVVQDCRRAVLMVADGRGVATDIHLRPGSELAVLTTAGGAPGLVQTGSGHSLKVAERGYFPGFPQGQVGEATGRYLGKVTLRSHRRGEQPQPALAWAETGRTDGLKGSLAGLAGAPVLDGAGAVAGVVLAEAPRRGRLYTASREDVDKAIAAADVRPAAFTGVEPVNVENYGRVADSLRRDMRVVRVACLSR